MTTTLPEATASQDATPTVPNATTSEGATPAEQAMAATLIIAAAAEASVKAGANAFLSGRIERDAFVAYAGAQIAQGIGHAARTGAYYAYVEYKKVLTLALITHRIQRRIEMALITILVDQAVPSLIEAMADSRQAHTALTAALAARPTGATSPPPEHPIVMRSTRLAHAEIIRAGRNGYAQAVAESVTKFDVVTEDVPPTGDEEPAYTWQFTPDATACARCLALAEETFPTFEDAPAEGGHPGCGCTLTAEYRKDT